MTWMHGRGWDYCGEGYVPVSAAFLGSARDLRALEQVMDRRLVYGRHRPGSKRTWT